MDYIYKINGAINYECIQFRISKNKANSSRFILRITTTAIVVFWHWCALVLKSIKIVLIIEHTYFSHYTLKFTTQG